eukprot:m.340299 g.340299  ORF g.340299 m.340299 type:complete len:260 (-) comp19228_c0_seq1:35-814(-)
MPRRGKNAQDPREELIRHLLTQPNGEEAQAIESHELKRTLKRRQPKVNNSDDEQSGDERKRTSPEGDDDSAYVIHILEPHHTLAGIALQYSVPVEKLMRANNFFTRDDLHSRTEIKIPVNRYGAIYHELNMNKDVPPPKELHTNGVVTHTTARARPATEEDLQPAHWSDSAPMTQENDTAAFLENLDDQMQSAIQAMDAAIKEQMENTEVTPLPLPVPANQSSEEWDWRLILCGAIACFVGAAIFVALMERVRAPSPNN